MICQTILISDPMKASCEMTDRKPFEGRAQGRLSELGDISSRPLFGGHGIYWRDVIFGIVFRGRLYFKVDEGSKGEYVAKGMPPFRPNERQTLKSYYEVPSEVLDDREAPLSWAREAIRAGQDSQDPASSASEPRAIIRDHSIR